MCLLKCCFISLLILPQGSATLSLSLCPAWAFLGPRPLCTFPFKLLARILSPTAPGPCLIAPAVEAWPSPGAGSCHLKTLDLDLVWVTWAPLACEISAVLQNGTLGSRYVLTASQVFHGGLVAPTASVGLLHQPPQQPVEGHFLPGTRHPSGARCSPASVLRELVTLGRCQNQASWGECISRQQRAGSEHGAIPSSEASPHDPAFEELISLTRRTSQCPVGKTGHCWCFKQEGNVQLEAQDRGHLLPR
jgi:hypothetical protein